MVHENVGPGVLMGESVLRLPPTHTHPALGALGVGWVQDLE